MTVHVKRLPILIAIRSYWPFPPRRRAEYPKTNRDEFGLRRGIGDSGRLHLQESQS